MPELEDVIEPREEIIDAARAGELVLFVGAGVSMLEGLPSWHGFAGMVLEDLRENNFLNYSDVEQLSALDPKKQLSIACDIAKQKEHSLDFGSFLTPRSGRADVYPMLNKIGSSCVTTNYDLLLAPEFSGSSDGSETKPGIRRIWQPQKFLSGLHSGPGTVIHLHGCLHDTDSMVITTEQYLRHYDNEHVQTFLNELFDKKTVVFLGYGLAEAEVLEHILRRGGARKGAGREFRRFVVEGFFSTNQFLFERLHEYYEKSFGVKLLGFSRDSENYRGLRRTIEEWASKLEVAASPLVDDYAFMEEVLGG